MEVLRKKIIVVDDDKTNLIVARNALSEKFDVFTVPSGEKLFGILEKLKPDMVLLDIQMPEMNGYEVIKILKNSEHTSGIPVIFMSARESTDGRSEGLSLGALDYIIKPFLPESLIKSIEQHLQL